MRTTLTLDDALAAELKRLALERGVPFRRLVDELLRTGLRTGLGSSEPLRQTTYQVRPTAMGQPHAGVDLTRALQLADALEDAAIAAELERRV
jgi:hypothetical protein